MLHRQQLSDLTHRTRQPANPRRWLAARRVVNWQYQSLRSGLMSDHVNKQEALREACLYQGSRLLAFWITRDLFTVGGRERFAQGLYSERKAETEQYDHDD